MSSTLSLLCSLQGQHWICAWGSWRPKPMDTASTMKLSHNGRNILPSCIDVDWKSIRITHLAYQTVQKPPTSTFPDAAISAVFSSVIHHLQRVLDCTYFPKTGVADQLSGSGTERRRSTFSVMKGIRQHFCGSVYCLVDCLKLQIWNAGLLQRINSSFDPMSTLTNAPFPIAFKHMVLFRS